MAVRYYLMPTNVENGLDILSILLAVVYNVEACIKLIAYDSTYFTVMWNRFDLTIVLIADMALLGEIQALR